MSNTVYTLTKLNACFESRSQLKINELPVSIETQAARTPNVVILWLRRIITVLSSCSFALTSMSFRDQPLL